MPQLTHAKLNELKLARISHQRLTDCYLNSPRGKLIVVTGMTRNVAHLHSLRFNPG
jgi:hypothetical protein